MYEDDLQELIYKNSQIHKFILIVKFKSNPFITLSCKFTTSACMFHSN